MLLTRSRNMIAAVKISLVFLCLTIVVLAAAPVERKKVLILGAGVAGITAAKTLYDQGITDFLVLEGQDYVGGRIKQVSFAGMKVEEGVNWIHFSEEKDNPLIPLRNKHNLTGQISNYTNFRIRNIQNHGTDEEADMKVYKEWLKTSEELFEMGEERGEEDIPPRDMPASTALQILGWKSDTPLKKVLSWFVIDFEYGDNEHVTSLNNMGPPGADLFITDPRGIWSLFSDFYLNFEDKILLNKTVSKIKYDNDGVEVTTAGGETFIADYALCTFSSGVLNSESVQFDPPLPDWKKEAIYRLRPVHMTKIFLKFPSDFWDNNEWIYHVSVPNPAHFPAFFDLDRTGFFPGSNALFTAATGDEALRVETQDDSKTMEEVMEVLRSMYGSNVTNATDILISKWSQNPYTLGSWTDPVIGTDSSVFANMAGRLNNLFFAGEGTHGDWYGFMQGAYFSGLDRANEIASCIKGKKCESYLPSTGLPVIVKTQDCTAKSKASQMAILPVSLLAWLMFSVGCF